MDLVALEEASLSADRCTLSRGRLLKEQTSDASRGVAARAHL